MDQDKLKLRIYVEDYIHGKIGLEYIFYYKLDNVKAGTKTLKANEFNFMCLGYGTAARIMAAHMSGLRKYFLNNS